MSYLCGALRKINKEEERSLFYTFSQKPQETAKSAHIYICKGGKAVGDQKHMDTKQCEARGKNDACPCQSHLNDDIAMFQE